MAKLELNDDGTVTLPLAPKAPGDPPRSIVLPEPTMAQLATIHELAVAADDALPAMDTIVADMAPEQVAHANDQLRARTVSMFGQQSPHGLAMIAIVKLLTGEDVGPDDLYGWVMGPRTMRDVLAHFQAPLAGEE